MQRVAVFAGVIMLAGVAAGCVPPPDPTPPPVGPAIGTCFDYVEQGNLDSQYTGPAGVMANLTFFDSTDGSCSGEVVGVSTAVVASDAAAALTACEDLDPTFTDVTTFRAAQVPAPGPNFFICV